MAVVVGGDVAVGASAGSGTGCLRQVLEGPGREVRHVPSLFLCFFFLIDKKSKTEVTVSIVKEDGWY